MPLVTEHLRPNVRSHPDNRQFDVVDHAWTMDLVLTFSTLIEEDGGPPMAHGSGYGEYHDRPLTDHTFQQDYPLPFDQGWIRKGDRVRMWREQIGVRSPVHD